jgi:hypothetical protein
MIVVRQPGIATPRYTEFNFFIFPLNQLQNNIIFGL